MRIRAFRRGHGHLEALSFTLGAVREEGRALHGKARCPCSQWPRSAKSGHCLISSRKFNDKMRKGLV